MSEVFEIKPYLYKPSFIKDISYEEVDRALIWEQRDAPRAEAYYAQSIIPYTYGYGRGVRTYTPHLYKDADELILYIKRFVESQMNEEYEMLFCNKYDHENQHLGWHADDSPSVNPACGIPVVSFGAERDIMLRANGAITSERITLEHGSLFYMKPGTQQTHQHRIPKAGRKCDPRISLTFRGLAHEN